MPSFWTHVNKVIRQSDILLLVLDARFPKLTRNPEIEQKVRLTGKPLIYVINKCDLVKDYMQLKFDNSVLISAREKKGGTILFKRIMQLSKGNPCTVGVIGYPNTGKSSVINLLKGKASASVSSQSGHTRGVQLVTAKSKITLMDTPGVLPFNEDDKLKQVIIGSVNPQRLKDVEYYAMKLVEEFPSVKARFNVSAEDPFEFLEKAAISENILKKGGEPDVKRFSVKLLQDWQRGSYHSS